MHVAAIGATGSGKSTALRGLMADAIRRGDRHVVADPEGTAMMAFEAEGDIILNPFDARCARWDLLGEIERPSDYAFLAQNSEERRVGKEGVSTCTSRWSPSQ